MSRAPRSNQPTSAVPGDFLDIMGAAAYLGVKESFVRRLVLEKRVRYYKVGKLVRFRATDLDTFLTAGIVNPEPVPSGSTLYSRRR